MAVVAALTTTYAQVGSVLVLTSQPNAVLPIQHRFAGSGGMIPALPTNALAPERRSTGHAMA